MTVLSERLALIISADTKGATRDLNALGRTSRTQLGGAESDVKRFADSFRKSAPYIGAATGAIAAGLFSLGQSASELSSTGGALDATFKTSAGGMRRFAEEADRLGLSQANAQAVSARLGAGLQAFGFSAGESADEVETLVARAADMAVGFGTTEQALNAISALLRGERDPIEQYGVAIKEADVKARLAAQGLDELTGEALKNAQAVASLELLYEATADRVGLYGSAANRAAREQAEFTAKLENLQAEVGARVLPAMASLLEMMNDAIDDSATLNRALGGIFEGVTFGPAAGEGGDGALGAILEQLRSFGSGDELDALVNKQRQAEEVAASAAAVVAEMVSGFTGAGTAVSSVLDPLGAAMDYLATSTADATDEADDLGGQYSSIFDELFGYQDALAAVDAGSEKVAQAHRAHADAMRDATDAAADVRQAQLDVAAAAVVAFDATDAARQGIADYADEQRATIDPVFAMIRALERQEELLKQASGGAVEREGTKLTASGNKPTLLDFAEGAADVEQATVGLAGALKTGQTSIEEVRGSLRKWVQQGLLTESQAAELATTFEVVAARAVDLEGATVDQAAAAGVAEARLEAEAEAADRVRDAQERLQTAQERLVTAQERVADTADDLSRSHSDAARKAEALDRAMFELNQEVQENPGLIGHASQKLDDWVRRGLIPASEKTRIMREMLEGVNAGLAAFGGDKRLHIEVTSNAMAFLDFLAGDQTLSGGSIVLRDRLAGMFSGATGGRVPGPMGQPRPILAHGGEYLSSNVDLSRFSQAGAKGGVTFIVENITVTDPAAAVRELAGEARAVAHRTGLG